VCEARSSNSRTRPWGPGRASHARSRRARDRRLEHAGWPGFRDRVSGLRRELDGDRVPLGADLITTVPNAPRHAQVPPVIRDSSPATVCDGLLTVGGECSPELALSACQRHRLSMPRGSACADEQRVLPRAAARRVMLRLTQEGRTSWPTSRQQSSADATIGNSANARRRRAPVIPRHRKRNKRAGATRRPLIET
jgi:hypothetical protein